MKITFYKKFDLGDFYSRIDSSQIDEKWVNEIEKWYLGKPSVFDEMKCGRSHTISDTIGSGTNVRAYRLDTEDPRSNNYKEVIKELFPVSNLFSLNSDSRRYEIDGWDEEKTEKARRFIRSKIISVIESARHSKIIKSFAIKSEISTLLDISLVMTSIGLCQISQALNGQRLDAYIEGDRNSKPKEELINVLEHINTFLKNSLTLHLTSTTINVTVNKIDFQYKISPRLNADIKAENIWKVKIDENKSTIRTLDFSSFIEVDEIIDGIINDVSTHHASENALDIIVDRYEKLFESTKSYYSKDLINKTIKQITILAKEGEYERQTMERLLVQLDLIAIIKLLVIWVLKNPCADLSQNLQSEIFYAVLSYLGDDRSSKVSLKNYHVCYLFTRLISRIELVDHYYTAEHSSKKNDGNVSFALADNILTGEALQRDFSLLLDILEHGDHSYADNHANLDDGLNKLLESHGIATMEQLYDYVVQEFDAIVHPGKILSKIVFK